MTFEITIIPGCMIYDLANEPEIIEQPDSKYMDAIEYKCKRCGHSFSERYPTRIWGPQIERCKFDG